MAKKQGISSNILLKPIAHLIQRFHLTIFFIFIIGCLAWAVLLVNNILIDETAGSDYTPQSNPGSIDQATLDRIQALHTSQAAGSPPSLPGGRINPFGE